MLKSICGMCSYQRTLLTQYRAMYVEPNGGVGGWYIGYSLDGKKLVPGYQVKTVNANGMVVDTA